MENEPIEIRARQQLKAAILQYQNIGAKQIVLEGYGDSDHITIAANIPVSIARGAVQLSAWMMISVEGTSNADWAFSIEAAKLAKRMPKIEGDSQAYINFEYVPKKGSGANILFNGKPSAGKSHEHLPKVPLEKSVDYLPITYDDVAGAIHFNLNTGGSEGMDIHLYVIMHDFGNVLEARAILQTFNITVEGAPPDAEFAKKAKPAPKETKEKPKTAKEKEDIMTKPKTGLPAPDILTTGPGKKSTKSSPVVEETAAEEVPPPVVADEEEEETVEEPVVEETTEAEEVPPPVVTDEPEASKEEEEEDPEISDDTAPEEPAPRPEKKRSRPSNALPARIERAKALLEENNYEVKLREDEAGDDPLVLLDQVNAAVTFIGHTNTKIADILQNTSVDPEVAEQLKALVSKL
jgi:hypothetical protein